MPIHPDSSPQRKRIKDRLPVKERETRRVSFINVLFVPRRRPPNFIVTVAVTVMKALLILSLVMGVSGIGIVMGVAKAYAETIPELDTEKIMVQSLSSFIYDRNGEIITTYRGSENRILSSIDEIPENLRNAFIAVEDARFYTHNGVDIKRIAGAFVNNMRNDSVQGGSTITQQLIKLQLLSTEQTYKRKIQEAYMAIELEKIYDKDQILEWYLNTIWLGESNYGVLAAVRDYFGKELSELTLRECAVLAGITRNPTRYNPRRCIYTTDTPEISVERTNYVLHCMYENNFITQDEYLAALGSFPAIQERFADHLISEKTYRSQLKANMRVIEKSAQNSLYEMPAAVETVLYDVETRFMNLNGMEINEQNRKAVRSDLQNGGYRIYTTIDSRIQKIVEDTVYHWDKFPSLRNPSNAVKRDINKSSGIITQVLQPQAAVSIFDYHSGEIVAIVGSRTPPGGLLELNRARTNNMPVGSSIKPISVYGPALDMGASPASVANNMTVPIPGWGTEKGYPSNSTRGDFKGYVTFRQALKMSLNTATANTLMDYVGINDSKNYLISLGVDPSISHINEDGFGLALGSSGITPLEMSVAYGTIANKGSYQRPLTFTKVVDSLGNVVIDAKAEQQADKRQVLRPGTSWMITDMLIDAVESGVCGNAKIKGVTVAGKTGTNSDYVGVSFSGYTPYYSCSVWIGHDDYLALESGATGNAFAAPLWQAILSRVHGELELEDRDIIEDAPESMGLVKTTTCTLSGGLATDACQSDPNFKPVTDWWHADSLPTEHCAMHMATERCMESGGIAGAACLHKLPGAVALLIPEGSPAEGLSPEQLQSQLPGAILHVPEGATLDTLRQDPVLRQYFCTIHPVSEGQALGPDAPDQYIRQLGDEDPDSGGVG